MEVTGEKPAVKNTSDKKVATTLFNICNIGGAFKPEAFKIKFILMNRLQEFCGCAWGIEYY